MTQQIGEHLAGPYPADIESPLGPTAHLHLVDAQDGTDPSVAAPTSLVDLDPERYQALSLPGDVYKKVLDTETRDVLVESDVRVDNYMELARTLGPWAVRDVEYFIAESEPLQGIVVEEVNPTANGGGVQMILATQTNLLRDRGIIDRWGLMVSEPGEPAFRATKDWHNNIQGVAHQDEARLRDGMGTYEDWLETKNAAVFRGRFADADIVTIHDPQPHGLMPEIPEDIPVIWRSHIQNRSDLMATPGTPQNLIWDYIYDKVSQADAHVYHPVDSFVPHNVPEDMINFMPATFDPFDDLNRLDLTPEDTRAGREFIDEQLNLSHLQKPENVPAEENWDQTPIDWNRPIIALIARFDPSKGMPEAVRAYIRAREMMAESGLDEDQIPQFVLLGNSSIDDPDGPSELVKMMKQRSELDESVRQDVKVVRVPHNDKAINTLMMEANFGLQPSTVEGFETRASDWIWHGKPVIVSNRGGLPWQVHEGKSGHIIDPENIEQFAKRITEMTVDRQKYEEMCEWSETLGKTYNYREFSTIANGIRWVRLYRRMLEDGPTGDRVWKISEIVDGESEQKSTERLMGSLAVAA